jgi:hypothetical protein
LLRNEPVQRPLQLTHVREPVSSQFFDHTVGETYVALGTLGAKNCDTRFVVRFPDVDDEATGKASDQPLVDVGDLVRRAVTRHHDLTPALLHRVQQTENLRLRLAMPGEKLHVVEQQQIDELVPLAELVDLVCA